MIKEIAQAQEIVSTRDLIGVFKKRELSVFYMSSWLNKNIKKFADKNNLTPGQLIERVFKQSGILKK